MQDLWVQSVPGIGLHLQEPNISVMETTQII